MKKRFHSYKRTAIQPTAALVYTSGSGLDPHITVESAYAQIARVADARGISTDQIAAAIDKHTQGRFWGIFGEPGVNVLNLNRELDVLQACVSKINKVDVFFN